VTSVDDSAVAATLRSLREDLYDAALCTHAFLHGTPSEVASLLQDARRALHPGAPLYATFGSRRDARYGAGRQVAQGTFASETGDEAGVAHCFFDEDALRALLAPLFLVSQLEERGVDRIAGRWAHGSVPLAGAVH